MIRPYGAPQATRGFARLGVFTGLITICNDGFTKMCPYYYQDRHLRMKVETKYALGFVDILIHRNLSQIHNAPDVAATPYMTLRQLNR